MKRIRVTREANNGGRTARPDSRLLSTLPVHVLETGPVSHRQICPQGCRTQATAP